MVDAKPGRAQGMRYLRQLDGLRAFAVLLVFFDHFAGRGPNQLVPIGAGNLGVNLFFTLSGFLITGILLQAFDASASKPIAWRNFYIRRVLRLAPIMYVTVAVLALMGIGSMAHSWPWHIFYASNFYIAAGGEKTVFWTLAVEEQFYLFWPFVIAFAPRRWLAAICVAVFALGIGWKLFGYAVGIPRITVNAMLPGSFEPLAAGCLLAALSYRGGKPNQFDWLTPRRQRIFGGIALLSFVTAIVIFEVIGRASVLHYVTIDGMMAIAYGWVVVMAAHGFGGAVGKVLEHPVANYVGRISYGLYVVHNWIPDILERVVGPMPKAAAAPIVLVVTFAICALSFRYFETPIRDFGHRLRSPRRSAAQAFGSVPLRRP